MNRRRFAASILGFAAACSGCTSPDPGGGGNGDTSSPTRTPTDLATGTAPGSPTETPSDSPTDSPTETRSNSGAVTDTSFEILDNSCGTGEEEAAVEQGADRIIVRGTISGRNGCFTAELERASYDTDAGEMTVAVRSFSNSDGDGGCTECIVDIEYRATVSYDANDPETVTVLHNDEQVEQSGTPTD